MPNTYTNLLFHIVYGTKYRKPLIKAEWQDDLYGDMGGIIRDQKGILLSAGGMPDHVHLLAKLPPTIAVSDMLRLIKANSSKWAGERDDVPYFEWQEGYAAFSVSESQVDRVRDYVLHQEEHHRTMPFKQEYLGLLRKHKIEFDERYVFEEEHIG
jgi:REP element-mobilizing transposase RayT